MNKIDAKAPGAAALTCVPHSIFRSALASRRNRLLELRPGAKPIPAEQDALPPLGGEGSSEELLLASVLAALL